MHLPVLPLYEQLYEGNRTSEKTIWKCASPLHKICHRLHRFTYCIDYSTEYSISVLQQGIPMRMLKMQFLGNAEEKYFKGIIFQNFSKNVMIFRCYAIPMWRTLVLFMKFKILSSSTDYQCNSLNYIWNYWLFSFSRTNSKSCLWISPSLFVILLESLHL